MYSTQNSSRVAEKGVGLVVSYLIKTPSQGLRAIESHQAGMAAWVGNLRR